MKSLRLRRKKRRGFPIVVLVLVILLALVLVGGGVWLTIVLFSNGLALDPTLEKQLAGTETTLTDLSGLKIHLPQGYMLRKSSSDRDHVQITIEEAEIQRPLDLPTSPQAGVYRQRLHRNCPASGCRIDDFKSCGGNDANSLILILARPSKSRE
jgi:hypothetical protein